MRHYPRQEWIASFGRPQAGNSAAPARRRTTIFAFLAILAVALALRLAALVPFSMHHPDEIFQYLEPAHRLAFGQGITTWEFRYGMRGWLLPTVLSWAMESGNAIAPGGNLYLTLPRLLVSLASLSIPIAAFSIGQRRSLTHGLVAMAVMSLWFECIYFSAHVLSEQVSVILFLPAAALMLSARPHVAQRYALAGMLLGLAAAIRFQNAPAIALFAAMTCGRGWRGRWLPLIAGGGAGLALSALADLAQGATPFGWILANVTQNVVHDRATGYGTKGPAFYLGAIALYWLWLLPVMLAAIRPAIGRHRALFATAMLNIALLSLIGHKEYRFILLSTTILALLAAIGSVDLLEAWSRRTGRAPARCGAALVLLWALGSASLAAGPTMAPRWAEHAPELGLVADASRLRRLCGLAFDRLKFWQVGGYTYLHRAVPLYLTGPAPDDRIAPGDLPRASRAFDAIITPADTVDSMPKSFAIASCRGGGDARLCLLQRPGGCDPAAAARWNLQTAMLRHDW